MPTPKQVRAARALLNWEAKDLAKHSKLTAVTISNFETGKIGGRAETLDKISKALTDNNIEFIGQNGVILKEDELTRFTGENVFLKVLDDVVASCRNKKNSEALFACVVDKLSPAVVIENYRRLRKEGIRMRSLVKEGDTYLMGKLNEYRVLPEKFFHNNPIIIYGNKVAFMIYSEDKNNKMAVVLSNSHTASAMRNLFELIWQTSDSPKESTAEVRYE